VESHNLVIFLPLSHKSRSSSQLRLFYCAKKIPRYNPPAADKSRGFIEFFYLMSGACADVGGEEYMTKAVDIEPVEVIFGEIKFEAAFEVSDAPFQLIPVEGRN
jgi:hypothetical protein